MTHIESMRNRFRANKKKIQQMLGWDDLQYGRYQYEMGLRYLRESLQLDDWNMQVLEGQRLFWQWWINEWNLRDEHQFLPLAAKSPSPEGIYESIHDIRCLRRRPDDVVLSDSYALMIEKLRQEQLNQSAL